MSNTNTGYWHLAEKNKEAGNVVDLLEIAEDQININIMDLKQPKILPDETTVVC